jgi:alpha-galactosidase
MLDFGKSLSLLTKSQIYGKVFNTKSNRSHPDADMLEIGNGMTITQERSHFALWALLKSPLIIGTDMSLLSTDQLAILANRYLLAFHQDANYAARAVPYKWGTNADWTWNASYPAEYWAGESSNGTIVAVLNNTPDTVNKTVDFAEVPGLQSGTSYQLIDVWTGDFLGAFQDSYTPSIAANDTAVILVQSM